MVSVRVKGRPREAVLADMIEGVVVTNGLVTPDADRIRNELWETMQVALRTGAGDTSRGAA